MEIRRVQKRVKTYGRVKDNSPMTRVLLFIFALLIFTFFLTLARGFIVDKPVPSILQITGAFTYPVQLTQTKQDIEEPQEIISPKESLNLNNEILALSDNDLIKELPEDAIIELKANKVSYTIKKGSVSLETPQEPDVTIELKSKYVKTLSSDFCGAIRSANQNKDLKVEQHLSLTMLTWKYKSMLKHKSCLGF